MRPPTPIPAERIEELKRYRKKKWAGSEFQRFLCVWLRVESGLNPVLIGKILGWHVNTVRYTQLDFIKRGREALEEQKRGGRRRELMTLEEERDFLKGFDLSGERGELVVAQKIKSALEKRIGRRVHKTTIYRMLRRHGWRKVCPRPRHPKQNQKALEDFKKRALQNG
jgi:transposase